MNDKDLLKYAAKAIHLDGTCDKSSSLRWVDEKNEIHYWDPLNDDGDAFRLAVALGSYGISIDIDGYVTKVEYTTERDIRDPASAARRAIVRAAAEIGKSL